MVQNESYRALVERLPDALVVFEESRVVEVNPAAVRLIGASRGEELAGKIGTDFIQHFDRVIARDNSWAPALLKRWDGGWIQIEAAAMPLRLGEVHTVHLLLRETGKRSRREGQLGQGQELDEMGVLAGRIGHDFNNVLGAIVAFTHLAMMDAEDRPAAVENLDNVLISCDRAKELISQILAFSRERKLKPSSRQMQPLGSSHPGAKSE